MLEKGWVKHFIDGKKELGTDNLIKKGLASWSKGRLSNICAVDITENNYTYRLANPFANQWWQGDKYYARYAGPQSTTGQLMYRFVQYKIEPRHVGKFLTMQEIQGGFHIAINDNPKGSPLMRLIQPEYINKWVTMSIRPGERLPHISLKDHKG